MGYKQFYRFVFSLFLSMNILVYLAKNGYSPLYSGAATVITFGLSYLAAVVMFKKIGWRKHDVER